METFFGHKNYAKVDTKNKIVNKYKVTDASVHNSQPLDDLLTKDDSGKIFLVTVLIQEKNKKK